MKLDFIQGIVSYPSSNNLQDFMTKSGQYVSLSVANGPTTLAVAHGDANYLYTETANIANAWGPIPANTECWLYWDFNPVTAVRTFGFTIVAPTYGPTAPTFPASDLHWFNTTTNRMYVYDHGAFRECIRVFAAKLIDSTFSGLGTGMTNAPYAGSQVRVYKDAAAGRIVWDDQGTPIRRSTGEFFTTEDQWFVDGTAITAVRLESAVLDGIAQENIAKFQVVKYSDFGKINIASYNDTQTTAIAVLMEDLLWNEAGAITVQGVITNPAWNWSIVGAPLWISSTQPGVLTEVDAHVADPLTYPASKPPVARVLSKTQVFFDQGLGGKGDKGEPGDASSGYASATVAGVTRLSVNPVDAAIPIAVGNNDPRITQALLRSGGTMYGPLQLVGDPVSNLQPTTKQYVDTAIANAADSATLTAHVNNTNIHVTGALKTWLDTAVQTPVAKIGYLNNTTSDIQHQLDVLSAAIANPDQGATSITLQGDATGYWQTTPLNPTSAVITLNLSDSGINVGSYNSVTVNSKGLVIAGQNLPYLNTSQDNTITSRLSLNYTPSSALHAVNKQYVDTAVTGALPNTGIPGTYLVVTTDVSGRVTSGLTELTVSGDVSGVVSSTVATNLTLANVGVSGTYTKVTTDAKGRVTSGSNPTTLTGYGITDALRLSGGTMTGLLTLSGAPTQDLHAATKKYVDDYVANATQGGNVHNGLLGLQGGFVDGTDLQYYHLSTTEHATTQAMVTAYTNNSNSFLPTVQSNILTTLATGSGLPFVRSGVVTIGMTQNVPSTNTLSLGFGDVTRVDGSGTNPTLHFPKLKLELVGTAGSEAVVIRGTAVTDPYGSGTTVVTDPKLLLASYGGGALGITYNGSDAIFSGAIAYTFNSSVNVPSNTVYANSIQVTSGIISNTPSNDGHIANKKYVDDSILTALTGNANHNSLTGLQGGSSSEYYHITSAQAIALEAIRPFVGVLARRDVNNAFSASQSFSNFRIQAVGTPSVGTDAATKQYVDDAKVELRTARVLRIPNAAGTVTIDWAQYDEARLVITANVTLAFTGALDGQRCMIKIQQGGGGGGFTVTLPGTVRFSTDAPSYTASSTSGVFDRLGFIYDGDDVRYDFIAVARGYV
jgi:phage-related tail fiber protein